MSLTSEETAPSGGFYQQCVQELQQPYPDYAKIQARLWPFAAALGAGFAAAALGLAGLTWLAWSLLHHPRLPQHGRISLHDAVGVLQLVFASVAGAGALVAPSS
jgi:hypothetical protein